MQGFIHDLYRIYTSFVQVAYRIYVYKICCCNCNGYTIEQVNFDRENVNKLYRSTVCTCMAVCESISHKYNYTVSFKPSN